MKLITVQSQIQIVAEEWNKIYIPESATLKQLQIGHMLSIMDMRTATKNSVADIIGNDTWVGNTSCCACEEKFDTIIEIGFENDGDEATYICHTCIKMALEMFDK